MTTRMSALLLCSLFLAAAPDDVKEARDNLFRAIRDVDEAGVRTTTLQLTQFASKDAVEALLKSLDLCNHIGVVLEKEFYEARQKIRDIGPTSRDKETGKGRLANLDKWHKKYYELSSKLHSMILIRGSIGSAFSEIKKEWIVPMLSKKLASRGDAITRSYYAEALGAVGTAEASQALIKQLKKEKEAVVKVGILDALPANDANAEAAAKQLGDAHWQVKLAAAYVIERSKTKTLVPKLIKALDGAKGRVKSEINEILFSLIGVDKAGDFAAWDAWWKENGNAYLAGQFNPKGGDRGRKNDGGTKFYGIPITSDKIVFVIDASNSMWKKAAWKPGKDEPKAPGVKLKGDTKLDVAKYELKKALALLPDGTKFNVIFFNHFVWSFRPGMETLDRKTRKVAMDYIDEVGMILGTDVYEALQLSFKFGGVGGYTGKFGKADVDTLFVLSDGMPWLRPEIRSTGVTDTGKILEAVREWNKRPKITINTIGIETPPGGEQFLSTLAKENRGTYVRR